MISIETAVKYKKGFARLVLVVSFLLPAMATAETLTVLNKAEATASLIDLDSGAVLVTLPTGNGPHEAATSPDGTLVIAANYGTRGKPGNTLTLIDVAKGSVVKTFDFPKQQVGELGPWDPSAVFVNLSVDTYSDKFVPDKTERFTLDAFNPTQLVPVKDLGE